MIREEREAVIRQMKKHGTCTPRTLVNNERVFKNMGKGATSMVKGICNMMVEDNTLVRVGKNTYGLKRDYGNVSSYEDTDCYGDTDAERSYRRGANQALEIVLSAIEHEGLDAYETIRQAAQISKRIRDDHSGRKHSQMMHEVVFRIINELC